MDQKKLRPLGHLQMRQQLSYGFENFGYVEIFVFKVLLLGFWLKFQEIDIPNSFDFSRRCSQIINMCSLLSRQ